MKFPSEAVREAISEGSSWTLEGLTYVEDSGWMGGHKGEDCTYILEYQGKFYRVSDRRTGSDFSEWHYDSRNYWRDEIDLQEVKKVPVTTHKWVRV